MVRVGSLSQEAVSWGLAPMENATIAGLLAAAVNVAGRHVLSRAGPAAATSPARRTADGRIA